MYSNEFGICTVVEDSRKIGGRLDMRYELSLHEVKAIAGKDFHQTFIKSVCVYDNKGTVKLYLKKNEDGTITREEN